MLIKLLFLSLFHLACGLQPYIDRPLDHRSNDYFSGRILLNPNLMNPPDPHQDSVQGRIFGSLFHKLSPISLRFVEKEKKPSYDPPQRRSCTRGQLVEGKCFEIGLSKLNFADARKACQLNGGDLWIPNFNDVFLFQKLVTYLPGFFEIPKNDVWLGATRTAAGKTMTVKNVDVSNTLLVNVNQNGNVNNGQCLIFDFGFGAASTHTEDCAALQEFVCEYDYGYHYYKPFYAQG